MGLVDYVSESEEDETPQPELKRSPGLATAAAIKPSSGLFAALPPPKGRVQKKKIVLEQPQDVHVEPTEASVKTRDVTNGKPKSATSGLSALLPPPKRSAPSTALPQPSEGQHAANDGNGTSIMAKTEVQMTGSNIAFKPKSIKSKPSSNASAPTSLATASMTKRPTGSLFSTTPVASREMNDDEEKTYTPILATVARPKQVPKETLEPLETSEMQHASDAYRYNENQDFSHLFSLDPMERIETNKRQRRETVPVEIQDYNVEQIYAENQAALENGTAGQGDAAPVRFVGGGKHQLSSLLNLAHSQKDALEDSFARQKRAMRDSKAKYGR